ncbi:MAG: DUF1343 domain-containing protein [Bacteroidota bacterium]|nr:DUF1343 domain-containing protein [Bacteroidota bacterium]
MLKKYILTGLLLLVFYAGRSQPEQKRIIPGADQTQSYIPILKGKRVAMVANPTSTIAGTPTVDSLLHSGIKIVKVFGPEHGFRGLASNGAIVSDDRDPATGIPIISLYGRKSKPSREDLQDVDILVFDIQDVGARFYTYILTLQRVMESCAENHKPLLILDRPNPNGFYVDGPVLEDSLHSGIGGQPIPIVHGMTIGELARMINGEGWLTGHLSCSLTIIKVANYTHDSDYILPVSPSPNLNTPQSILLYPSLCLFEGTVISQGRGTYYPFTILGAPALEGKYTFSFKPVSLRGMSETPLHQDSLCYGLDLRNYDTKIFHKTRQLNLRWLMELYQAYPQKEKFFDKSQSRQIGNFDKLAGTVNLRKQIIAGVSEQQIRNSWEPALSQFRKKRKKYLLYRDFTN